MRRPHPGDFADLEIRIRPLVGNAYPVELTFDGEQEFETGHLEAGVFAVVRKARRPARQGQVLFEHLAKDEKLHAALERIRGSGRHLRLRLCLDEEAPELHALPWEALTTADGLPLAAAAATPFSRYLRAERRHGKGVDERSLRVLAVTSNPADLEEYRLTAIDPEAERAALAGAVEEAAGQGRLELRFLSPPATLERLEDKLRWFRPHVLHLIAHGRFNPPPQNSVLYLQAADDRVETADEEELLGMLSRLAELPRLIYMSSCESARTADDDAFRGFAPRLVRSGVPAVLAMRGKIPIHTARELASVLYRRLLDHGMVDLAANEARSHLLSSGLPGATLAALYLRLKDGLLLEPRPADPEPAPQGASASPSLPPPAPARKRWRIAAAAAVVVGLAFILAVVDDPGTEIHRELRLDLPADPAAELIGAPHPVLLARPFRVGQRHRLRGEMRSERIFTWHRSGLLRTSDPTSEEELEHAVLEAIHEVLEVDPRGRPRLARLHVERFLMTIDDGPSLQLLAPGQVVFLRLDAGELSFTFENGEGLPPDAQTALQDVLGEMAGNLNDKLFGSREPRRLGETWDLDPSPIAREFTWSPATVRNELQGRAHLSRERDGAGLELTAEIAGQALELDRLPPGAPHRFHSRFSALLPENPHRQARVRTLEEEYESQTAEGSRLRGQRREMALFQERLSLELEPLEPLDAR